MALTPTLWFCHIFLPLSHPPLSPLSLLPLNLVGEVTGCICWWSNKDRSCSTFSLSSSHRCISHVFIYKWSICTWQGHNLLCEGWAHLSNVPSLLAWFGVAAKILTLFNWRVGPALNPCFVTMDLSVWLISKAFRCSLMMHCPMVLLVSLMYSAPQTHGTV